MVSHAFCLNLLGFVCTSPVAVRAGVGVSDDPRALYHSMHSYLASSAVDGVKVDCQVGSTSVVGQGLLWPCLAVLCMLCCAPLHMCRSTYQIAHRATYCVLS
jgi:hypothetical protein